MEKRLRKKRLDRGVKARTDTIFMVASFKDITYLLSPRVLPVLFFLVIPPFLGPYSEKVFFHACVYGLLALSFDFLASCGLFSLGQSLFFGIGCYFVGIYDHFLGLPIYLSIPFSSLSTGLLCAALLSPVVRLRGVYFAMITLMLPMLLMRLIEATGVMGGTHGMPGITGFPNEILGLYLGIVSFLFFLFFLRKLMGSDYGLVLKAIKEDDRCVMSSAINIYWYKAQAVFIGASIGGFAGAITTHHFQFIGMSSFALDYSILPLAATALGGQGGFAGAALGSMILVPLSEVLRELGGLRMALYCLILVASILALPEGIFHFLSRQYSQFYTEAEVD